MNETIIEINHSPVNSDALFSKPVFHLVPHLRRPSAHTSSNTASQVLSRNPFKNCCKSLIWLVVWSQPLKKHGKVRLEDYHHVIPRPRITNCALFGQSAWETGHFWNHGPLGIHSDTTSQGDCCRAALGLTPPGIPAALTVNGSAESVRLFSNQPWNRQDTLWLFNIAMV